LTHNMLVCVCVCIEMDIETKMFRYFCLKTLTLWWVMF
jgi:hypothetical protein